MDDEKKGKKMSSEQGNLLLEVWVFFLHKIQSKDNTWNSEMNRFKELFASMLKCILLLSQQSGSAISGVSFLKSWNINIKFPLILRISNYAYVWVPLKHLFINKKVFWESVLIVFSLFEKIDWTGYFFISYSFILDNKILKLF